MLAALALLVVNSQAVAQVPDVVTVTAFLEEGGAPVDRAVYARFILWDAADGGHALWSEDVAALHVDHGVVDVTLGAQATNPLPLDAFVGPRWLEIVVDTVALAPRLRMASAPSALFAERAATCESLDGLAVDDVATRASLTSSGDAHVSWARVVDVPPAMADLAREACCRASIAATSRARKCRCSSARGTATSRVRCDSHPPARARGATPRSTSIAAAIVARRRRAPARSLVPGGSSRRAVRGVGRNRRRVLCFWRGKCP
jgi:hypothetical protein